MTERPRGSMGSRARLLRAPFGGYGLLMHDSRRFLAFGLLAAAGCGLHSSPTPGAAEPTAEQTAAAQQGSEALTSIVQSLALSNAMLKFDPDLNPDAGAAANAATIAGNVSGADGGGSSLTVSPSAADGGNLAVGNTGTGVACNGGDCLDGGTSFTINFGAGCTLDGITVSGSITVAVSVPQPGTLTVALTLTNLVIDGWDLAGTASFTTSDGSTLTVALDLTHSGTALTFNGTVTGAAGAMTIDGDASTTVSGGTLSATLKGVVLTKGSCWPSGGSVAMTASGLGETLLFTPATATSGQASVTYQTPLGSTQPACFELPQSGSCVPTACPG